MIALRSFFFSALIPASFACAQADSTAVLSVQCRDADTGAVLPYVAVILRRSSALPSVHIADLYGRVEIAGLLPGDIHIQARHQRYVPSDTTLVLPHGLIAHLQLSLSPIPMRLRDETPVQALSAPELIRRLIAAPAWNISTHTTQKCAPTHSTRTAANR